MERELSAHLLIDELFNSRDDGPVVASKTRPVVLDY
jgi:hypothetical protein